MKIISHYAAQHPFRLIGICLTSGVFLATGAAVCLWYAVMLPEKMRQIDIIEGTKLVRLMAADNGKRKCMESMMIRGKLVCLEQGGK